MRCTTTEVNKWVLAAQNCGTHHSSASPWPCDSHFRDTETAHPRSSLSAWEFHSMMFSAGTSCTAVFSCTQEIIKHASRQEPAEPYFLVDLLTPGLTSHSLEPIIFQANPQRLALLA